MGMDGIAMRWKNWEKQGHAVGRVDLYIFFPEKPAIRLHSPRPGKPTASSSTAAAALRYGNVFMYVFIHMISYYIGTSIPVPGIDMVELETQNPEPRCSVLAL